LEWQRPIGNIVCDRKIAEGKWGKIRGRKWEEENQRKKWEEENQRKKMRGGKWEERRKMRKWGGNERRKWEEEMRRGNEKRKWGEEMRRGNEKRKWEEENVEKMRGGIVTNFSFSLGVLTLSYVGGIYFPFFVLFLFYGLYNLIF
jgi:hypothetical protein